MMFCSEKKYINGNYYFNCTYVNLNYKGVDIEYREAKMGMNETPELDVYAVTLGFISRLIIEIENVRFHLEMS